MTEQRNSTLRRLKASLSYMTQDNFMTHLKLFLWFRNALLSDKTDSSILKTMRVFYTKLQNCALLRGLIFGPKLTFLLFIPIIYLDIAFTCTKRIFKVVDSFYCLCFIWLQTYYNCVIYLHRKPHLVMCQANIVVWLFVVWSRMCTSDIQYVYMHISYGERLHSKR